MNKTTKKSDPTEPYQFKPLKSYSVDEVLAAGGTSAFGHKMGMSGEKQIKALSEIPPVEFSDEEWEDLLKQLENDK
ncbi:hypothetical protein [Spirosoma areae]